jgi:hydroxymethylpyrimidine pyrophosphatase-like HAD family hydrolase
LNINLKETAGLGNDYNDIDFLDICEKSYVVENSPKILKDKYHVTVNNNESPLYSLISENTF